MATLQVYFSTKKEKEEAKKQAKKKGFDSVAAYIKHLIKEDKK
jgi:hypothetical protein